MTWKQLTERDRREWKLSAIDPHDRDTWRSGVRSAMTAACQLPRRVPTLVDMAPVPAHLLNLMMMMMMKCTCTHVYLILKVPTAH